ncbi:hypothetical protein Skr01_36590 [Sphaerisporangium krabiense]|uniref:Uncharacterized protein n=1 Tax=Sphaerisporangium krabiense TaxID=763782 RepID=A0A7W8Z3B0_9ACTN|nr:hypothetical protein [Sphaerisporangium krabiense]MBB5626654.1 hypothetical protein [Sphaerisporangium krabiense]GII63574.1 hypothetical protein Skr01_36590 [Sphaerisporangium krabiense]
MTGPASAERVLAYLTTGGRTIAETERLTGWPAHAIGRLIARQPRLQLDTGGRVVLLGEVVEPSVRGDDAVQALHAQVDDRRAALGFTWRDVRAQMRLTLRSLADLHDGTASPDVCERAQRWLATLTHVPSGPVDARELYEQMKARKELLGLTWSQVAIAAGSNCSTLNSMRRGLLSKQTQVRVQAWLAVTAPMSPEEERRSA